MNEGVTWAGAARLLLYVGALLDINSQTFLLTAADDYVFDFLERPDQESFQSIKHF